MTATQGCCSCGNGSDTVRKRSEVGGVVRPGRRDSDEILFLAQDGGGFRLRLLPLVYIPCKAEGIRIEDTSRDGREQVQAGTSGSKGGCVEG